MCHDHAGTVHAIMRGTRRSCWELDDLAAALGPAAPMADGLARILAADPRFCVLDLPVAVPFAEHWTDRDRGRYAPALRRAGLIGRRVVVLAAGPGARDADPARLLDRTLSRLADHGAVAPALLDLGRTRRLLERL